MMHPNRGLKSKWCVPGLVSSVYKPGPSSLPPASSPNSNTSVRPIPPQLRLSPTIGCRFHSFLPSFQIK
ncbi:hypothetical protein L6452_18678 [Arctium lappa]|uniref:Uncharacterized protein n=1 Tax=Arctium lappa TaxID=4217 RepID=A0ACB9C703_ARCLA|nr:hypothetical protein L6452_18678 [Arctium lappa]